MSNVPLNSRTPIKMVASVIGAECCQGAPMDSTMTSSAMPICALRSIPRNCVLPDGRPCDATFHQRSKLIKGGRANSDLGSLDRSFSSKDCEQSVDEVDCASNSLPLDSSMIGSTNGVVKNDKENCDKLNDVCYINDLKVKNLSIRDCSSSLKPASESTIKNDRSDIDGCNNSIRIDVALKSSNCKNNSPEASEMAVNSSNCNSSSSEVSESQNDSNINAPRIICAYIAPGVPPLMLEGFSLETANRTQTSSSDCSREKTEEMSTSPAVVSPKPKDNLIQSLQHAKSFAAIESTDSLEEHNLPLTPPSSTEDVSSPLPAPPQPSTRAAPPSTSPTPLSTSSPTTPVSKRFKHRRNLSLDFRAMGIELPPIPGVCPGTLHKIPETPPSSPPAPTLTSPLPPPSPPSLTPKLRHMVRRLLVRRTTAL